MPPLLTLPRGKTLDNVSCSRPFPPCFCLTPIRPSGRCEALKTVDLEIGPIYHRMTDRVKSHVFLCMLAYYVEWQMKQKLAPLLFAEEDREGASAERKDIVSPSVPSKATSKKAALHKTEEGLSIQTFGGLIEDLGTLVKNVMQAGEDTAARFSMLTQCTSFQKKAFELLGVGSNLGS